MSIDNLGSASSSPFAAIRDQFKKLRHGGANITKDDLNKLKEDLASRGQSTKKVDTLLDNYDKIDINGDGISFDELKTYTKSQGPKSPGDDSADYSKDDLSALAQKIAQAGGTVPEGLQQVLDNFDKVDTNQDGKVSSDELKAYADQNGIKLPRLGRHHHHQPLPASDSASSSSDAVDISKLLSGSTAASNSSPTTVQGALAMLQDYAGGSTADPLLDSTPPTSPLLNGITA